MITKRYVRIVIFVAAILIETAMYLLISKAIEDKKDRKVSIVNDGYSFVYDVQNIEKEVGGVTLSGWFFVPDKVSNVTNTVEYDDEFEVMLIDVKKIKSAGAKRKIEAIPGEMTYLPREDVNAYFYEDTDYTDCGFSVSFPKRKIKSDVVYQVLVKYNNETYNTLALNSFLYDGKIYRVNPKEMNAFEDAGADLRGIVESGTCIVNQPDSGFYVFQKEGELYWIADKNAFFEKDGTTVMQYQMYTTQFSKLPSNRTENGWYWSNISSSFEAYEITDEIDCGNYRVSVRDFPTEHSITHILFGYYDGEKWVWRTDTKPVFSELIGY